MNRRVMLLGTVAAFAVVVVWWMFVFAPAGKQLHTQQTNLGEAQHQADQLRAQVNQLRDLQSRSAQTQRALGHLSAAVPPTADQADFINSLNGISRASGITWQSVNFSSPGSGPSGPAAAAGTPAGVSATAIPLQIQIKGGFDALTDYLNRLETLDRLVVVNGVQITSGSGNSSSATKGVTTAGSAGLTVTLNAAIYMQPSAPAAPAAGTSPAAANGGGSTGSGATAG